MKCVNNVTQIHNCITSDALKSSIFAMQVYKKLSIETAALVIAPVKSGAIFLTIYLTAAKIIRSLFNYLFTPKLSYYIKD